MEADTVPIPVVRPAPAWVPDRGRQRVAATIGVMAVGVTALSTALFQSVVGSSTTVQVGAPEDGATVSPAAAASLDPRNLDGGPGFGDRGVPAPDPADAGLGDTGYVWAGAVR